MLRTETVTDTPERRFEALYRDNYAAIYAYVHRRLGDGAAEAPDVVAEVFSVAWRRIDELPAAPEDRLWLFGVAYRSVLRGHRGGRRRLALHRRLAQSAQPPSPAGDGDGGDRGPEVRAAIERLRPADRELVRLVLWDELSHTDAAAVLGCSVNAVAIRMHKVKARLRAELALDEGS